MADPNWKKISFEQINKDDKLKVERTFGDGTHVILTGRARFLGESGNWLSSTELAVAQAPANRRTGEVVTIHRDEPTQETKDASFVFPKNVGAIVGARYKLSPYESQFIFTGCTWTEVGVSYPHNLIQEHLKKNATHFRVVKY